MKRIRAALWMEILKVRRSNIFLVSILFFIFIGIMMGLLMFVSQHPEIASRSATISVKTSFLGESSWASYFNLLMRIILTVGVIGFGIITSWNFGREFSDRVVKDLLALPVPRFTIVVSKLIILFTWSILLAIILLITAILTGLVVGIPEWIEGTLVPFTRSFMICAVLNTLLITPVAFVASAGRGYLLPIGFVILIMILTQLLFVGLPGLAGWFPWAFPALVSGVAGDAIPKPGLASGIIYSLTVVAGALGTITWWQYADHK